MDSLIWLVFQVKYISQNWRRLVNVKAQIIFYKRIQITNFLKATAELIQRQAFNNTVRLILPKYFRRLFRLELTL